ncbi:alkaline phosphatase [Lederbergia galactosidilyticus]|nr:alkaline phosphatase [Lederbergia galactosidilytica]
MNKGLSIALLSTMLIGTTLGTSPVSAETQEKNNQIKNVIFMIGDGMGPSYTTAYRYLKDDQSTVEMEDTGFDPYLVGMQSVYSADPFYDGKQDDEKENITDSAAAATSMSSGIKTYNGAIAVDLEQEDTETVLEVAKAKGKSTGLVATSEINHATPAAYASHEHSRKNYSEIADDYFDDLVNGKHKVDVLLGGGIDYFERKDRNLAQDFEKDGYQYVKTTDELLKADGEQILGLFAPIGLEKAIDRPQEQPSLEQMTTKAIDVLSKNENGFFLMIEGSQIDWAGHDNDIVGAMSEMEDFEKAFNKAIEFAKEDQHTLVVATADHSTGGLSIGANDVGFWDVDVIKAAKHTPDYMTRLIVEKEEDIQTVLTENIDFDVTEEEVKSVQAAIDNASKEDLFTEVDNAIEHIFDERSGTGWTTGGHTGEDVPVYAYGPGAEMFAGKIDNTDNAKNLFQILGASSSEGAELADTATNYPASIFGGFFILAVGGWLLYRNKTVH